MEISNQRPAPAPTLDYQSVQPDPPISPARKAAVLIILSLSFFAALWFEFHDAMFSPRKGYSPSLHSLLVLLQRIGPVIFAAGLCTIPAVRTWIGHQLEKISHPSDRARRITTLIIAILAAAYFLFTSSWQGRDITVRQQDESMYTIQAQMIARGRLWLPAHECADFFESFHVLNKPVYAPIYFPGTALAYAPAIWLHIPVWFWAILIAGAGVGMTYRVIAEMIDGQAGALAAILVIAAIIYRHLSTMVMSHPLMMLLGLLMTWAFLRWRRQHKLRFIFLLGIFSGWAAISRPVDAIAYFLPLALSVAWELRKSPLRKWMLTAAAMICGAAPLISLQLILDYGVTGHLLQTPVTMYHQRYWPQVTIGYSGDLTQFHPNTDRIQFHQYYEKYILPSFNEFRGTNPLTLLATSRFPLLMSAALPTFLLAALLPLALFEMKRPQHWALLLALPLFLAGYATFMFFRRHYGIVVFPPIFLAIMLGAQTIEKTWPRMRTYWRSFFALAIVTLAIIILPELNPNMRDQMGDTPILSALNQDVRNLKHKPALIMVKHVAAKDGNWSQEPVYNVDVASPDDARIIRAHDLGPRNAELYRYYTKKNPLRAVYSFDKSKPAKGLIYLGTVSELAK